MRAARHCPRPVYAANACFRFLTQWELTTRCCPFYQKRSIELSPELEPMGMGSASAVDHATQMSTILQTFPKHHLLNMRGRAWQVSRLDKIPTHHPCGLPLSAEMDIGLLRSLTANLSCTRSQISRAIFMQRRVPLKIQIFRHCITFLFRGKSYAQSR